MDVARHSREPAVSLPMAPRRAVLQSISTQETVPVQRHHTDMPMYKFSENGLHTEAQRAVQDRMQQQAHYHAQQQPQPAMPLRTQREHLAPLDGMQNIVAANVQPMSPKRVPAPVTKETVTHTTSKKPQLPTPPRVIVDPEGRQYERHAMLGQGGFARVYHVTNNYGEDKAFKVIAKSAIMQSKKNRQKILAEIMIHKSLKHVHIVSFEDVFEDAENVYFVLELCHNGVRIGVANECRT